MSQNQSAARTQHTRKHLLSWPAVRRLALAAPVAAGLALAVAVIPAGTASARGPCMDCEPPHPLVTSTIVSSSANPSIIGQLVTYTATVYFYDGPVGWQPLPVLPQFGPWGTVGFTDDGTPITGCTAVPIAGDGTATCQATPALGTHTIAANYTGAAPFPPGYYEGAYTWYGSTGTMTQTATLPSFCWPLPFC